MREKNTSRVVVALTGVVAVTALALSIWALTRTPSDDPTSYSSAQQSAARTAVCQSFDLALRGVSLQTNATAPAGQAGGLATEANARLALAVGSMTLTEAVDENPAAPKAVQDAARKLAKQYRLVSAAYLAGFGIDQGPVPQALRDAGAAATALTAACR
ncbi:hypothetical protein [uncultured Williamsia sp.]|uniref:hypothetical protein n=1 Tax=uncultured Williamsia sp. TaxID=259311 RepID=UPI0026062F1C|nr:hypothetical protein [uncultured Williamsia sp.]